MECFVSNHRARVREFARKALGAGTRTHHARATMLGVAMGVTATLSAAPAAHDMQRPPASPSIAAARPWYQVGRASWYGGHFNGKRTASGQRYNENRLTCAHRSLPLGTWVRVTNLQNHRSTLVQVTDRGPFVKNVLLDLSHAAARKLGFSSVAKVRIDAIGPEDAAAVHQQYLAELKVPPPPETQDVVEGQ